MPDNENSVSTEISSLPSIKELESLFAGLRQNSFGIPLNQNRMDLTELGLSGLALHPLNGPGDPYKEDGDQVQSMAYEREVIDYIASLYELYDDAWGYITSGNSEGNLFALYMGREYLEKQSRSNISDGGISPILFFSEASRPSVFKAASIMGVQFLAIKADDKGEMDYADLEQAIKQYQYRPMLMVVNMGTMFTGANDNLATINDLLQKYNVSDYFIHCDAALSGMILPFTGHSLPVSFEKGIDSLVISGDSFLGSPIPSAMLVTREQFTQALEKQGKATEHNDITINGTRYGLAAIVLWYILQEKKEFLEDEVQQCLDNVLYLQQLLQAHQYPCFVNKDSITLVLKRPASQQLVEKYLLTVEGEQSHIVVMPHVTHAQLASFVDELVESEQRARQNQPMKQKSE